MSGALANLQAAWQRPAGMPWDWGADPDLWLYRNRTEALLRRYFKLSVEAGRLPSILGQEFFRSHVTSYNMTSFEDVVIFVHDVERCVERLDSFSRRVIGRIALQGFSQEEAARLLGCSYKTVARHYPEAIDRLSEIFLEKGIIRRLAKAEGIVEEACQEGNFGETLVTM